MQFNRKSNDCRFMPRHSRYCVGCPLESARIRSKNVPTELFHVKGAESDNIDVLFLGEAPGEQEDAEGRPFVGKSGKLVKSYIDKYANANYAVGNVVRCRPVDAEGHNRQPTPEERAHCIKYTIEQIDQLKPKKIVALGGVSAGAFLDRFRSVASIRGQEIPIKVKSKQSKDGWFHTKLCPTYHPAARDLYQLSFLPKDIFRTFRGFGKRQWDAPGKDHVVTELSKVRKLLRHIAIGLERGDIVAIDVETLNGVDRLNNSIISIAFSWDGVNGYSIPLDHPKSPWTAEEFLLIKKWLRRLFTRPVSFGYWLAHNTKFELQQLHLYLGVWARNRPWLDTMLIAFLLDENRLSMSKQMKPFNLKQLSAEELNLPYDESSLAEIIGARDEGQIQKLPWRSVCRYNSVDAWRTRRLLDKFEWNAGDYWVKAIRISLEIFSPALFMFAAAELNGFQINIDHLFELQSPNSPLVLAMQEIDTAFRSNPDVIKVNKKLTNDATGGMRPLFGSAWIFNPNKKAHLIELFVKHLKLPPLKWGKKPKDPKKKPEPSLDSDYFTFYNDRHPLAKKMNERQEIKKMATSFLDQIREFLEHNPECKDGRVRPQFHMGRTVTGRTACTNPNLQQIPRADTDYKKATKNIFTVKPGNVLVSADIAQGEVFLMAQTTGDLVFAKALHYMKRIKEQYWREPNHELKTILKNECDVHRQSASILYGVPIDKVTKEQRSLAKSIVTFGIIYGKAIKTIAEDLKISEKEAEKVQAKFFAKFKGSRDGLLRLEQMAKKFGFVESCIGRRRRLPQVRSEDQGEVARALRQARNSPIQSLLSDYTLFQAGKLHQYILDHNKNWKIVDAVHDAVIAEIPFHEVRDYVKVARRIMMDTKSFAEAFEIQMIVPMLVDIDVGVSYGDLITAETWSEGSDSLRAALKAIRKAWEDQGYSVDLPEVAAESGLAAAA